MSLRRYVPVAAAASIFCLLAVPATASTTTTFTTPVQLTGIQGGGGGEPSIATDKLGNVVVSGPQGIPSGLNGTPGVAVWTSHNDGTSFGQAHLQGSYLGGGDSDVEAGYDSNHTFYLADLEAAATAVCKSTDHGNTFISAFSDGQDCNGVVLGQAGPSNDREWLTADPTDPNRLYLTYHEFVSAQPMAFRSANRGADNFAAPCGPLVSDPAIEANIPTDVTGGTLVSKPVVDKAGNLYVMFTTTTQAQNAAAVAAGQSSGTFSQIYMAVSKDHCQSFTDHVVYDGAGTHQPNTVQFGDIFNALAIDGGGNLSAVAAGYIGTKPFDTVTNLYDFHSTDGGSTWSAPTEVAHGGAHMLPAAVGGPSGGQLALGYFHTTNGVTNPNDPNGVWTYTTAETTNSTAATPTFKLADVRPGFVYHRGIICNQGILCTSGRDLLDFTSATVDGNGCPLFTFAGNPNGVANGTYNYVTRQTSGCFSTKTKATGGSVGGTSAASGSSGSGASAGKKASSGAGPTTSTGVLAASATLPFTGSSPLLPLAGATLAGAALIGVVLRRRLRA